MERIESEKTEEMGKQPTKNNFTEQEKMIVIEENQEFAHVDEEDTEAEMILPDLPEEDPLKIDDIKPEINVIHPGTERKWTGYILWSANRRKELLKTDPALSFSEITKKLIEDWEFVSEHEKCAYRKQAIMLNAPTRQSNRQRKPKEIEDLVYIAPRKANNKRNIPTKKRWSVYEALGISTENSETVNFQHKPPKSRFTAYSLWAQEVRVVLLNQRPEMTFGEISTNLSTMWKSLPNLEKYNFRRRARRMNEKVFNPKNKEKETEDLQIAPLNKTSEDKKISSKGRVIVKPTKLADFHKAEVKRHTKKKKSTTPKESSDNEETDEITEFSIQNGNKEKYQKYKKLNK